MSSECKECQQEAQYLCSICGDLVCSEHSKLLLGCKAHSEKKELDREVKIRKGRKQDEERLEEIEEQTIIEHQIEDIDEEEWEKKWQGIETESLVAEVNGELIGFVEYSKAVSHHEEPVLTVTDLAIDPNYQGYGIGKKLIESLKKEARKKNVERVFVSCSSDNILALYFHLKQGALIYDAERKEKISSRWGIEGKQLIALVYKV